MRFQVILCMHAVTACYPARTFNVVSFSNLISVQTLEMGLAQLG